MNQVLNQVSQQENKDDIILSLDAFVRSVGIRKATPFSVFIGAGASISSGMPSAEMCIWEWKRSIFLTNNPGLEDQFSESSLPGVRSKIQRWLDEKGNFPTERVPEEYSFYIQQCFPIADDRRAYFEDKVRESRPHIGYQLLCHLAESNLIRSVWSTNFDGLPARAAGQYNLTPLEVGIDSKHRLERPSTQGELLCVSLHGDYRYDALKNTSIELQTQEAELHNALIRETRDIPLIVSGYSGRDESVMKALYTAYSEPGSGTLYWCGFTDSDVPSHIAALVHHVREHGRQAYYIPTLGFDDLITRLALHCLDGQQRDAARHCISAHATEDLLSREPFEVPNFTNGTLIKSNAFKIQCPAEVLQFDLMKWPSERAWAWLRERTGERPLVAVPFRKVLALGTIEDIQDAFNDYIKGPIERTPVGPNDLKYEDGAVASLMREALVRSMAEKANLKTDGSKTLWRSQYNQCDIRYHLHDALTVSLRDIGGVQHLVLMPTLKVFDQAGVEPPKEIANSIKLRVLSNQYNKQFNQAVNSWRTTLFPEKWTVFPFPHNAGSTFKFRVQRSPIFARIGLPSKESSLTIPDNMQQLIKHRGIQLTEPELLFSNKSGTKSVKDTHPIKGILNNQPFDYPLTYRGLVSSLRIGVVCPADESKILNKYLQSINQKHAPGNTERDYLLDYPGFQMAYGLPIELPALDSAGWKALNTARLINRSIESLHATHAPDVVLNAARLINRSIESLHATHAPDVVLIFIPDRWEPFRSCRTESESFDLHNLVKAFCAQRGIATQFLDQDTLSDSQQCRVWWWLSLALYVKSMRIPWLLDNLADDTAFVGLGTSIGPIAQRGDHVVLGCSHIYSAQGEGLQYRLNKIENPIFRRHNPFMSADDARRVGETIRDLFFDARMKLPERVVLHKRTPFTREEQEGLRDGLSGIAQIDMLEIQIDHTLRYLSSIQKPNGKFDEDSFPVRRGTVMKLDNYSALLWVHGATTALNPGLKYFQGKRRIPAPLIIRRYAGRSPLQNLASEILGLSKMNWNTFDLYTKLPATLQSSGEIAKIGSLLQRFGSASYDYRLFI